jgi:hypothetical protein
VPRPRHRLSVDALDSPVAFLDDGDALLGEVLLRLRRYAPRHPEVEPAIEPRGRILGEAAESATCLSKASLFVISRSAAMARSSCRSLRSAPLPVTSKVPNCGSTLKCYM